MTSFLFGICGAFILTAALETLRALLGPDKAPWTLAPEVYASALPSAARLLWILIGLQVLQALLAPRPVGSARHRVERIAVLVVASCGSAYQVYATLILYKPFAGQLLFITLSSLLALFLAAATAPLLFPPDAPRSRRRRTISSGIAALAAAASAAIGHADVGLFHDQYPTLHLSLLQTGYLLLQVTLTHLFVLVGNGIRGESSSRRLLMLVTGLAVLSAVIFVGADASKGLPYLIANTTLGRIGIVVSPYSEDLEVSAVRPRPNDGDVARFETMSGLPPLPPDFRLEDYNILLLTSEALRFDQTSLADPALATTPELATLRDAGAFVFTRAYSPASGTLASMAAMMTMTVPSMCPLVSLMRPWHGTLRGDAVTAAEVLRDAGYDTFQVDTNMLIYMTGLEQGFTERVRINRGLQPDVDVTVADEAIGALRGRARSPRRFFGWVFFVSPHEPYAAHYAGSPARTPLERYRQEISFMDAQAGRILRVLDRSGLLQRTIVIFAGDHGEEFGEHGGEFHMLTVYSESIHVPLVVWIPGVKGKTIASPVSTLYLFPWLLLRGTPALRRPAVERITRDIGPILRVTGGAVPVELIGHDRMKLSLVYPRYKLNYDFISGLYELFDLRSDPYEQRNLIHSGLPIGATLCERATAYREVRAANRRFTLRPHTFWPEGIRAARSEGSIDRTEERP